MSKKRPDGSIKKVTNTGWQKVNQTVDTIISFFLTICLLSAELYCCLKRMKLSKKMAQFKTINSSEKVIYNYIKYEKYFFPIHTGRNVYH